jgi:hypothetical protein
MELSYREGSAVIVEPSEEEMTACRRDPWTAWNSARADEDAIVKCGPGKMETTAVEGEQ